MPIAPVTSSRTAILDRIRRANGRSAEAELRQAEWEAIPRNYRKTRISAPEELQALFEQRLKHYEANTYYLQPGKESVPRRVAELLNARNKKRLITAPAMPREYLPADGFEFIPDIGLSKEELNAADGVITMCTLGIALTGTIVLESAPDQGRRATTLIPDYHLCLLRKEDLVEFVPEAIARLQAIRNRPLTVFSGPSATVDIEMVKVRGVHGPRALDVLII